MHRCLELRCHALSGKSGKTQELIEGLEAEKGLTPLERQYVRLEAARARAMVGDRRGVEAAFKEIADSPQS